MKTVDQKQHFELLQEFKRNLSKSIAQHIEAKQKELKQKQKELDINVLTLIVGNRQLDQERILIKL